MMSITGATCAAGVATTFWPSILASIIFCRLSRYVSWYFCGSKSASSDEISIFAMASSFSFTRLVSVRNSSTCRISSW